MKKIISSLLAGALALSMCFVSAPFVKADAVDVKPFIAFGADLTNKEKSVVLQKFGLSKEELADYEVIEVTNSEEHEYLDEYVASSVIGKRALSSVMIEEADAGSGIDVTTHNVSFCTEEMYTNALATAGIEDATVVVAGPFSLSGTAALVGAMKAYGTMTGEEIDSEQSDVATNELVLTGELGETVGKDEAAQFVATLKNKVVSGDLSTDEEIAKAIKETEEQLGITLNDNMKQEMTVLMKKINGLDLNADALKDQAKDIYDKLEDMGVIEEAKGLWDTVSEFFVDLWDKFMGLF